MVYVQEKSQKATGPGNLEESLSGRRRSTEEKNLLVMQVKD